MKLDKNNQFVYMANDGIKCKGYFKIYQAKSGAIILMMGTTYIPLSLKQVNTLAIDPYILKDFSHMDYQTYYSNPDNY